MNSSNISSQIGKVFSSKLFKIGLFAACVVGTLICLGGFFKVLTFTTVAFKGLLKALVA